MDHHNHAGPDADAVLPAAREAEQLLLQWPISGRVRVGSTRKVLVVDATNANAHVGMRVLLYKHGESDILAGGTVEAIDGDGYVLRLTEDGLEFTEGNEDAQEVEEAGDGALVGMAFETVAPVNASASADTWSALQVMEFLAASEHSLKMCADEPGTEWHYKLFAIEEGDVLTPESTQDAIEVAFSMFLQLMRTVQDRGAHLGLLPARSFDLATSELQIRLTQQLNYIRDVACAVYTVLMDMKQTKDILRARSGGNAVIPHRPWFWSSVWTEGEGMDDQLKLFEFCLMQAKLQGVRKRGDIVYAKHTTNYRAWTPLEGNPKCGAPGCDHAATFGQGGNLLRRMPGSHESAARRVQWERRLLEARTHCIQHAVAVRRQREELQLQLLRLRPEDAERRNTLAEELDGLPELLDLRFAPEDADVRTVPKEWATHVMRIGTNTWEPKLNSPCVVTPAGAASVPSLGGGAGGSGNTIGPMTQSMCSRPLTIRGWIHQQFMRDTRAELYATWAANYSRYSAALEGYMRSTYDPSFPEYVVETSLFAFRNGIYDADELMFHEFLTPWALPDTRCCINFVDRTFHPNYVVVEPDTIAVPGYDAIVATQYGTYRAPRRGYDGMVRALDVFSGRIFYRINQFDSYQKLPVIKGFAATGKSSITNVIEQLVGAANVGLIASACEEKWVLSSVYDKAVWMCKELKNGFRMDNSDLQSIVTGEKVTIRQKNLLAWDVVWNIHGIVVGNELPASWTMDVSGALGRRILVFPFDISPSSQNTRLASEFSRAAPAYLARCTRQYRRFVQEVGTNDLQAHLPECLKRTQREFSERSDPVLEFLSSDRVQRELSPDSHPSVAYVVSGRVSTDCGADEMLAKAGLTPADIEQPGMPRIASDSDDRLLRVSEKDLEAKFREWFAAERAGGLRGAAPPRFRAEESTATARKALHLVRVHQQDMQCFMWYGVRLAAHSAFPDHGGAMVL